MARIYYGDHTYGTIEPVGGKAIGKVVVGKYCSIAGDVRAFLEKDHNMNTISTYPFGHKHLPFSKKITKPDLPHTQPFATSHRDIHVGNDVWLGFGSILFRGVHIGDGACIGAFSVITKDVPPYSVAVGHSRIVRKRFAQEDIDFLLKLKWWDFEDQVVADIAPLLRTSDFAMLRQWAKERQ